MKRLKVIVTAIVLLALLCQVGCKSDSKTQSGSQNEITQSDSTTQSVSKTEVTDSTPYPDGNRSHSEREIVEKVRSIISTSLAVEPDNVRLDSRLDEDLGADEYDLMDIVLALEKAFDIHIEDADWDKVKTVNDAVEAVKKMVNSEKKVKVRY